MTSPDRAKGGARSATNFKILCVNANSIGRNPKRRNVFHHLKKKDTDFVFICDTRFSKAIENDVREEWGGQCFFSSYSSQARGVAILFKKDTTARVLETMSDINGNIVAVLVKLQEKTILLQCL